MSSFENISFYVMLKCTNCICLTKIIKCFKYCHFKTKYIQSKNLYIYKNKIILCNLFQLFPCYYVKSIMLPVVETLHTDWNSMNLSNFHKLPGKTKFLFLSNFLIIVIPKMLLYIATSLPTC